MGSPITFSGFNSIDWSLILEAVMQQERQPVAALQSQKTTLESQNNSLGTLLGKLTTLDNAITAMATDDSVRPATASSSSTNVTVSASDAATQGTYDLLVTQLARSQVIASSSTYSGVNDVVATGGTLTITPGSGDPFEITVTASTTLAELAASINDNADSPVTAAVVQSQPGIYRLVLTGKEAGSANAFTVSSTLSGGASVDLAFTDTNGNGIAGDDNADLIRTALNALFTVNGLAVEASSNIVSDVIPGATLTLQKADALETTTVSVTRDDATAIARLQSFINAFNDIVQFTKDQTTAATAGRANLASNPMLRGFRNAFRSGLQGTYAEGNSVTQLAQIGLGFDRAGKLTLNRDVFTTAMNASPSDVQALLSGTTGRGGAFGALQTTIDEYTQAGGLVSTARTRMSDQIKRLTTRLDAFDAHLAVRRTALQKQFLEAERLMSQLNSQGSSLSQLGASFRSML